MNALTRSAFLRRGAFGRLSKSLCMAASGFAFHSANLARPVVDTLARRVFGDAGALLNLAFKLFALAGT
jgi:hypothetical protein